MTDEMREKYAALHDVATARAKKAAARYRESGRDLTALGEAMMCKVIFEDLCRKAGLPI